MLRGPWHTGGAHRPWPWCRGGSPALRADTEQAGVQVPRPRGCSWRKPQTCDNDGLTPHTPGRLSLTVSAC